MGRQLVASIRKEFPKAEITAAGTNSIATSNMLKAGADHAATGENAVVVGSRKADIIIGPVGIAIADSMYGEITPAMAAAVGQSDAKKLLIPMNQCNNVIVGVKNTSMSYMVEAVIEQLRNEEQKLSCDRQKPLSCRFTGMLACIFLKRMFRRRTDFRKGVCASF